MANYRQNSLPGPVGRIVVDVERKESFEWQEGIDEQNKRGKSALHFIFISESLLFAAVCVFPAVSIAWPVGYGWLQL